MQSGGADAAVVRKKQTFGDTFRGADCVAYKWSQTITDLDVVVPVPPEVRSANDVDVKSTPESLRVATRSPGAENAWKSLVNGELSYKTKSSELMWSLEPGKMIGIHMEKVKERWWESLLKDEPKINLEEMELTRPIFDLSDEEQMTLQKIWSKQLEKVNGPERSSPP